MGPEVHLKRTRAWALEEGFSDAEAELVARADIGFDKRYPARESLANITKHFAPGAWRWSAHYFELALRWQDLMMLGYALHCAQDAVAHGIVGEKHLLMLGGRGRNPDSWEEAPAGVKRRIEAVTREGLRGYRGAAR